MAREVGNRYSEEEALKIEKEDLKATYKLDDQENFNGTPEELDNMQYYERCYFDSKQVVTDEEWDILKNKFNYKETLESISPSGRKFIKLSAPLASLNKAGNKEEFDKFMGDFDERQEFIVEPKLDGLCANVIFTLNKNKNMYEYLTMCSRGIDYGMEFHKEAFYGVKMNFPNEIPVEFIGKLSNGEYAERLELRGEAIIPINEKTLKLYSYKDEEGNLVEPVWRNTVAGMTNRKVPKNFEGLIKYWQENSLDGIEEDDQNYYFSNEVAKSFYSLIPDDLLLNDEGKRIQFRLIDNVYMNINTGLVTFKLKNVDRVIELRKEDFDEYMDVVFYSMAVQGTNLDAPITENKIGSFKKLIEDGLLTHVSNIKFRDDKLNEVQGYKETYRITKNRKEIEDAILDFYGNCRLKDEDGKEYWNRDMNLPRLRNLYQYALDGVVIKPANSTRKSQKLDKKIGRNGKIVSPHYPSDQIAVKLRSEVISVKLIDLDISKTKLKNSTISGVLDHPYRTESGSMVSRINLHNPEWLELNPWITDSIKNGTRLDMVMSMDIIPLLLKPLDK